jgi:2-isopropylmalate synthase
MEVPPRQPYGGELVFTAFSGSHQDAINKGLAAQAQQPAGALWDVPYLPIDPKDIGRNYRAIIRINAQSGKGGVAWVMEKEFGLQLPKAMHREIGRLINDLADTKGLEIAPDEIYAAFKSEYLERDTPFKLLDFRTETGAEHRVQCRASIAMHGATREVSGGGNGPIDAFVHGLLALGVRPFEIMSYSEHSLGKGADSRAVAYIQVKSESGYVGFGAGMDTNIEIASMHAILSALNRAAARGGL